MTVENSFFYFQILLFASYDILICNDNTYSTLINNICKYAINWHRTNPIIIIYKNNYKKIIPKYTFLEVIQLLSKTYTFLIIIQNKKKIPDNKINWIILYIYIHTFPSFLID